MTGLYQGLEWKSFVQPHKHCYSSYQLVSGIWEPSLRAEQLE